MSITVGTDSWVTLAEANTYFESHIGSAPWDALTENEKEKYLKSAYRWIFYDNAFTVSAASTETGVKYGQCEAALFLINYYTEYDKHDAMGAMGIKKFRYSKRSEDLSEVKKPASVINYFSSLALYSGGVALFEVSNDETDI
jgi:hypothetical protein